MPAILGTKCTTSVSHLKSVRPSGTLWSRLVRAPFEKCAPGTAGRPQFCFWLLPSCVLVLRLPYCCAYAVLGVKSKVTLRTQPIEIEISDLFTTNNRSRVWSDLDGSDEHRRRTVRPRALRGCSLQGPQALTIFLPSALWQVPTCHSRPSPHIDRIAWRVPAALTVSQSPGAGTV